MKSLLLFAGILVAGLVHAAEPVRVVFQLDWIHNVQFAGAHWAKEKGLFEAAGLDVEIRPFAKNQETVAAVLEAGAPVFGSAESNVILGARAKGAPIVAVATMFQGSPMGWMSLEKAGIQSVADLKGKRVGVHPDGDKVIDLVLRKHGLSKADIQVVTIGHDPSVLLEGQVDAAQGYWIDEFVKLQLATGGSSRMLLAKDLGYAGYSQVVFTTEETLVNHPRVVRAFLKALQEGWVAVFADREAAVDLTIGTFNPGLDRAYQRASLDAIAELMMPDGIKPMARMTREQWMEGQRIFMEAGILSQEVDLDELVIPIPLD